MRTVELLPDEELEQAVRDAWGQLADAGLPSQAGHADPSNRPHVTVAVVDDWDSGTTALLVGAMSHLPLPMSVEGLRTFGQRRLTLVASLALTPELIVVHEAIHDILEANAWGVEQRHVPGGWIPHLTLARGLDRTAEIAARQLLGEAAWPAGYAAAARTYDTENRSVEMLR